MPVNKILELSPKIAYISVTNEISIIVIHKIPYLGNLLFYYHVSISGTIFKAKDANISCCFLPESGFDLL